MSPMATDAPYAISDRLSFLIYLCSDNHDGIVPALGCQIILSGYDRVRDPCYLLYMYIIYHRWRRRSRGRAPRQLPTQQTWTGRWRRRRRAGRRGGPPRLPPATATTAATCPPSPAPRQSRGCTTSPWSHSCRSRRVLRPGLVRHLPCTTCHILIQR